MGINIPERVWPVAAAARRIDALLIHAQRAALSPKTHHFIIYSTFKRAQLVPS